MRILFATGRDHFPDRVDGAILSAHALLQAMCARGHDCEAIVGIRSGPNARRLLYAARRLFTRRRQDGWPDLAAGYPTWRMWSNLVPGAVVRRSADWGADVIFTQLEYGDSIARAGVAAGTPVLLRIPDVEFNWLRAQLPDSPLLSTLVASQFVAERVRTRLGMDPAVLPPIIPIERYRVSDRQPRYITLINPVVEKGVEIALALARRLPHREFLFVECWPLLPHQRALVETGLRGLSNVRLVPRTLDVRDVYRQTALLLMPSQWQEGFGRVAVEAQASGIPVVASSIGGIPEAVAGGGAILLAPDAPVDRWVEAVERVLGVPGEAERLGAAGLANVSRPEFDPEVIADRFEALVDAHAHRRTGREATLQTTSGSPAPRA